MNLSLLKKIQRAFCLPGYLLIGLSLVSCGSSQTTSPATASMEISSGKTNEEANEEVMDKQGNLPAAATFRFKTGTPLPWIRQGGAQGGVTQGNGIDVDKEGNSYITGETTTGISGQALNGVVDFFIAKYDPAGKLQWTRQAGANEGETYGQGIRVDNAGNSYVTGDTNTGLAGQKQTGEVDYFLAKYDREGIVQWIRQSGASGGATHARGISIDNAGNSYVTGSADSAMSGQAKNGSTDYFIAKYDPEGKLQWTKQFGVKGLYSHTQAHAIHVDNLGNSYVTGDTNAALTGQVQQGGTDYFVAKHDATGELLWVRQVGATGDSNGTAMGENIGVDSAGNSYITGSTFTSISGQEKKGELDYFIAKYDPLGTLQWTRLDGGSGGWTSGLGISVDSAGNSQVTGNTNVGIAGQALHGRWDYFVAHYDTEGKLQWTTQNGVHGGNTFARGIRVDNRGYTHVAGNTDSSLSDQTSNGSLDYFIAFFIRLSDGG